MKKRILSALCAVMLLVSAVPMASAQSGDTARRADALTVLHLLSDDSSRDLTAPATRGQAAVLLVRLAGGEEMQVVDTEQIYTGAQGIKAKIPAGYTLLEETVQPETDETYAYYGFDTYNDRIGYSLGKVVDMIPEEITSVDEISDHCAQRDSAFYTGGFIAPTQRTEIGGREMLCSEGYITENPELVYAVYDMLYEGSLVTATFRYGKKDYGKRETRLRIESLLKGIELE